MRIFGMEIDFSIPAPILEEEMQRDAEYHLRCNHAASMATDYEEREMYLNAATRGFDRSLRTREKLGRRCIGEEDYDVDTSEYERLRDGSTLRERSGC